MGKVLDLEKFRKDKKDIAACVKAQEYMYEKELFLYNIFTQKTVTYEEFKRGKEEEE